MVPPKNNYHQHGWWTFIAVLIMWSTPIYDTKFTNFGISKRSDKVINSTHLFPANLKIVMLSGKMASSNFSSLTIYGRQSCWVIRWHVSWQMGCSQPTAYSGAHCIHMPKHTDSQWKKSLHYACQCGFYIYLTLRIVWQKNPNSRSIY